MRVTFLGTGTSVGVPRIACHCAVCRSADPRNQRLRCSILMAEGDTRALVDTTPDLRTQVLRFGVKRIDAVLFTHAHADHLHGLDDVRCFCLDRDAPLPCYADRNTLARIRHVFDYAFDSEYPSTVPQLTLHPIQGPFPVGGLCVEPVPVYHGKLPILGFRVGGFAYVTDCSRIPPPSLERLRGLDTLVLNALRPRPHPTHFSVAQAVDVVQEVRPRRALFTHIAHDLEHQATNARLPPHVQLAFDGLVLEVG
ncbi:MAG: MBL fold metallo-hydrolase [Candidatus Latescibacterota bacterium]